MFSTLTGSSVTFTAHDRASTPTVTAKLAQASCSASVTFTVIEPTGVLFENFYFPGDWEAPPDQSWIGGTYFAKVYVQPDSVNFYRIQLYEGGSPVHKEGHFLGQDIPPHPPNGPHAMGDYVTAKGSMMERHDHIGGQTEPPFLTDGWATWKIDWSYNIGNGTEKWIETVEQRYTLHVNGDAATFCITKDASGACISTGDEEQHWIE